MTTLWLISYIALWALFLVLALVLLSVMRNLGTLYESLAAPQRAAPPVAPLKLVAGQALPDLTLPALSGDPVALSSFAGEKTAFFVVSPGCAPCVSLLEDPAANESASYPRDPTIRRRVIVSAADADRRCGRRAGASGKSHAGGSSMLGVVD